MGNFDNYYVDGNGNVHRDVPLGTSPADAYVRTNMKLKKEVERMDGAMQEVSERIDEKLGIIDDIVESVNESVSRQLESTVDAVNESLGELSDSVDTRIASMSGTLNSRVDNIIAHNNDSDGNSELIDIRTGQNSVVYQSAGGAVRSQFADAYSRINACSSFLEQLGFPSAVLGDADFVAGGYVDSNGYRTDGNYRYMRTHHRLLPLDSYTVVLGNYISDMLITAGLYSDENGSWLRAYPMLAQVTNGVYTVDAEDILAHFPGTRYIRINVLSYSNNTYHDISDVAINIVKAPETTIVDDLDTLSQDIEDLSADFETTAADHENLLQRLVKNEITKPLCYNKGYKSISVIGDSISQGAIVTDIPGDSYCGILRRMFSAELGGKLNYGFSAFDKSTDLGFETSTVTWVYGSPYYGWGRNHSDSTVLGGDSYTSTSSGAKFCFKLWHDFRYMQIAIVGGSDKGSFSIKDSSDNVIAEIDCTDYPSGACLSEKIDISGIDTSNGFAFVITTNTADPVIISGVSLSDSEDFWTFNNYGRAGASPSVFTGNIFTKQSECEILIYAMGVNSGISDLNSAIAAIQSEAAELSAKKVVLCLCFKGIGFDNRSGGKPAALKAFAEEIGAVFIDVYEHCPKDSSGNPVEGFLAPDNIHPTNEGHRFIAELIAKTIGLSCNSKGMAELLLRQ